MDFLKAERLGLSCPFTSDTYALIYIEILYLVTYVQLLKQLWKLKLPVYTVLV